MYNKILSIDTSMHKTSIAVLNKNTIDTKIIYCNQRHEKNILTIIHKILQRNNIKIYDIKIILVSKGPGYFTSIRIGVNVAQGLSIPHKIPLFSISTLKSLAEQAKRRKKIKKIIVCIPTNKNNVYWGQYINKNEKWNKIDQELLLNMQELNKKIKNLKKIWYFIGSEKEFFISLKNPFLKFIPFHTPNALDLITIFQSIKKKKIHLSPLININYLNHPILKK
ncbi:tRNA threonylcarbamoyladenosine biosynthesis protein TsaB [Buchnera aphidicola (Pterocallis alni)]|uniref:tRNA (adenosine(37)-N6)-threonylcarbamoyltransferase complex dimerization subunit type 1 TsaB n=1 Tax=Buchnera aphidicola TaxID=9 RepID=UPI0034638A0E